MCVYVQGQALSKRQLFFVSLEGVNFYVRRSNYCFFRDDRERKVFQHLAMNVSDKRHHLKMIPDVNLLRFKWARLLSSFVNVSSYFRAVRHARASPEERKWNYFLAYFTNWWRPLTLEVFLLHLGAQLFGTINFTNAVPTHISTYVFKINNIVGPRQCWEVHAGLRRTGPLLFLRIRANT